MFELEPEHLNVAIAFCISPTYTLSPEGWERIPEPFRPPVPPFPFDVDVEILLRVYDNEGHVMVDVMPDGQVILYDEYNEDIAARRFWASLMWFAENNHRSDRGVVEWRRPNEDGDEDAVE